MSYLGQYHFITMNFVFTVFYCLMKTNEKERREISPRPFSYRYILQNRRMPNIILILFIFVVTVNRFRYEDFSFAIR